MNYKQFTRKELEQFLESYKEQINFHVGYGIQLQRELDKKDKYICSLNNEIEDLKEKNKILFEENYELTERIYSLTHRSGLDNIYVSNPRGKR